MNIEDLYGFTSKEKVEKALAKNKKNIKHSNIVISMISISFASYVYLSTIMGITDIMNVFIYLGFSISSFATWKLLKHRHMKQDFLYKVNERMKEKDNSNNQK